MPKQSDRLAQLQTQTLIEMVNRFLSFECNHSILKFRRVSLLTKRFVFEMETDFSVILRRELAYKRKFYANFPLRHGVHDSQR
jgi:hypothetical protein